VVVAGTLVTGLESRQICSVSGNILKDGGESVLVGSGKVWGADVLHGSSGTAPNTGFEEDKNITTSAIVEVTAGTPHTFSISAGSIDSDTGGSCAHHIRTTILLVDMGAL